MSGHTSGPWTIDIDPPRRIGGEKGWDDHGGYRINAPGVEQLAYVWNASNRLLPGGGEGPTFGSNESEANARLIAAAPELLEALIGLLQDTQHKDHNCGEFEYCPVLRAREVVAKATQP